TVAVIYLSPSKTNNCSKHALYKTPMADNPFISKNRSSVMDILYAYEEQLSGYKINQATSGIGKEKLMELKLDFYTNLLAAHSRTKNRLDKKALRYIRSESSLLRARLDPSVINYL